MDYCKHHGTKGMRFSKESVKKERKKVIDFFKCSNTVNQSFKNGWFYKLSVFFNYYMLIVLFAS